MGFSGDDYSTSYDHKRLSKQIDVIKAIVTKAPKWWTLRELHELTGIGESSISAQLRNLKKPEFGKYVLERRPRGRREDGLYEYRIMPPGHNSEWVVAGKRRNKFKEALQAVVNHPDCTMAIKLAISRELKS